ncbi:hypothetical protein J7K44_02245 [bacterium]|nr:hypothetical protein [bacterium]
MRKFLLFIILITIFLGILGFYYYHRNLYSREVLKLEILGPEKVKAGEEIEYIVKYKNNGKIRLEDPYLIFEYPPHSLPVDHKSQRITKELSDIYPGEEKSFHFKARLFGKEGEVKKAKASLSYRPKNLKAYYESATTFVTQIETVPLTFEFNLFSRVESGRELKFYLNYFSQIDYPLSDLEVKIEYPSGFQYIESRPSALENNSWEINSLNKNDGGRIEIKGILTGKVGEQKVFKATLGMWQEGEFVVLKEISKGVEIIEPSLYIYEQINNSPQYVASLGDLLHYQIFFKNIGNKPFENLFLVTKLQGELFDFQTIRSDSGQCEPGDNSVIWDWRQVPELRFLDAGEEGKVEFWIELKKDWPYRGSRDENLQLVNKVIFPGQGEKEFVTKVNSRLEVSQAGFIGDEIFGSEGPLPLEAGKESFFTLIWRVKNFYNIVENVKVSATLSPKVRLTGKILPEEASLTYDSKSREIIWNIDKIEPGKGIKEPYQLAFQVALMPTEEDIGKAVPLISEVKILGEDKWTGEILSATSSAVDTGNINPDKRRST